MGGISQKRVFKSQHVSRNLPEGKTGLSVLKLLNLPASRIKSKPVVKVSGNKSVVMSMQKMNMLMLSLVQVV